MAKYRAVLMVPSVVEFENPGTQEDASKQVQTIAAGLGKAQSMHPRQEGTQHGVYEPKVLECVVVEGEPQPPKPKHDLEIELELA